MSIRFFFLTFIVGIILLSMLSGCEQLGLSTNELPDDGPAIPVSEAAARSFLQKNVAAVKAAAQTGMSRLTITQEEITSVIALSADAPERVATMVAQSAEENDEVPNLPNLDILVTIEEPQVYFKADGTIILRGRIEFRNSFQPFRIVTRPSATAGTVEFDFVEGCIGPVAMPESIFDQLGNVLAQAILLGQEYVEVSELRVQEGTLTVAGRAN